MQPATEILVSLCERLGGQAEVARLLDVTPSAVNQWCRGTRPVPPEQGVELERKTSGAVACEALCPDHTWVRVENAEWPNGKPLLDMAPDVIAAAKAA